MTGGMMFWRKEKQLESRPTSSRQPRSVDEALVVCQRVFDVGLRDGGDWNRVREVVLTLGRVARAQDVAPERMLADFKQMLSGLPALQELDVHEKTTVIERLVTLSIDAYYEGSPRS